MFFWRGSKEKVVYSHKDRSCGAVVVADQKGVRYLKFGNHVKQGAMLLKRPDEVYLKYQRTMLRVFERRPFDRCLCLGLGAGSIPKYIHQQQLCKQLEVVEINPHVVEVATTYFELPEAVRVHTKDAMDFVVESSMSYDLLFVDLFDLEGTPLQFKAFSFYQRLHGLLNEGGAVVVNMWAADFGDLLLEEKLKRIFDRVEIETAGRNHIVTCIRMH